MKRKWKNIFFRKAGFIFLVLSAMTPCHPVSAQSAAGAANSVWEVKESFLSNLRTVSIDSLIVDPLSGYCETELSKIYSYLHGNRHLGAGEKEKAVRSMIFFMRELNGNLMRRQFTVYEIPGAINSYKAVLTALILHKPLLPLLAPLDPRNSQLIATAFSQYTEHSLFEDVAVYKRVASSPEYILQFLENKPGFRFADSLLLEAVAYDPLRVITYMSRGRPDLQERIRHNRNIYLQQIVSLADEKYASELLPFVTQITYQKISPGEILEKRKEATSYFQMLVNELQASIPASNSRGSFLQPLRNGIREKAIAFYVNELNALHDASDGVRFAVVKNLRPQDIYYIITSCGEELYTSSYLGLYKRLMEFYPDTAADSLFDAVQDDNFNVFIRMAANYNVLHDFLHRMQPEKSREILQEFIGGIEKNETTALERAMDIADCFTSVSADEDTREWVRSELEANLRHCRASRQYLGIRLYGILSDIFSLATEKDGIPRIWATLGDYDLLKYDDLVNKKGEIVELVLFYGDDDGISSFRNFMRLFSDNRNWQVSRNEYWVSIHSLSEQPLTIYANLPLEIQDKLDTKAQDSLMTFLKDQSLEPSVLVHRGHSYHLDKTMRRLTGSVRLAILGSCGGYNRAISIATISPDVQVIGSKKTGTGTINDPIIVAINETLINKKDIRWPELWKTLEKRFSRDEGALSLFREYFPPGNNLGLFVLKLYKYYSRAD